MIRVLIDTNIAVDFVLDRPGFTGRATEVFRKLKTGNAVGFMSGSAITDFYYIVERATNERYARNSVEQIYCLLRILTVDSRIIGDSLRNGMKDFEDAVQTEAAKARGIDIVVTRDKIGFADSGLTVLSPAEFVKELK